MDFFSLCMGKQTTVVTETFSDVYVRTGKMLGKGAFGTVEEVRCTRKDNNNLYAAKIIEKKKLRDADVVNLRQEIDILKSMKNHPNIVTLYEDFNDHQYNYLVIEKMNGGELFDRIMKKKTYSEKDARDVSRVLFEAIGYCHGHKVAHRDLKPENLLLMSPENDLDIKIADFGLAKVANDDHSLLTRCGTINYVCPEILLGVPYGTKADMWSLGVIIYILLAGYTPFYGTNSMETQHMIKKGAYTFDGQNWDTVSDDAKDLIRKLLTVDPGSRITASEALASKWIQNDGLESHDLGDNLVTFKKFNAKRKLKHAVFTLIATDKIMKLGTW